MMKLIRKIKKHEMLRRWAIAEVYVMYNDVINEAAPQHLLRLLHSNEVDLEHVGIRESLKPHHLSLINCLPEKIFWYVALLEMTRNEFDKLNTLRVPEFEKITEYSCKVADAAIKLCENPNLNIRINNIKQNLISESKAMQWLGLTLISRGIDGPFVVVEGNGRLISLYQLMFLEKESDFSNYQLEVVLGISEEDFELGYQYVD